MVDFSRMTEEPPTYELTSVESDIVALQLP
jgi:hypothetical protein